MEKLSDQKIAELVEIGFNRWTKGGFDRLYINAEHLGLKCLYYNTGNIRYAKFDGETISNCQARRYKGAKTYIDIKTGKIHSDYGELISAARKLAYPKTP